MSVFTRGWFACIVLLLFSAALGQDPTENDAKQAILSLFPNLAVAVPQNGDDIAWPTDVNEICSSGLGNTQAGVVCGPGGEILQLRYSDAWGDPNPSSDISTLSGLESLSTFDSTQAQYTIPPSNLLLNILDLPTLTSFHAGPIDVESLDKLSTLSGLSHLTLFYPPSGDFSFSQMSELTDLHLTGNHFTNLDPLNEIASQLVKLTIDTDAWSVEGLDFSEFVNLQILELTKAPNISAVHPSLSVITLHSPNMASLDFSASSLDTAILIDAAELTNLVLPDTLQILTLERPRIDLSYNLPSNLEKLTLLEVATVSYDVENLSSLKHFEFTHFSTGYHIILPNFTLTALTYFSIQGVEVSNSEQMLCQYLPAQLLHLTLSAVSLRAIPDCISRFADLIELNLNHNALNASEVSRLSLIPILVSLDVSFNQIEIWPFDDTFSSSTSLNSLDMSSNTHLNGVPFPNTNIFQLLNLRKLFLANIGFIGTVAPSFFVDMAHLQTLDLSYNSLNGSFPNQGAGLQSLTYLNLRSNYFSAWSLPAEALMSSLTYVDVSYNLLTEIPTDEAWNAMTSLKTVILAVNPLQTALPIWWASHPQLETFEAGNCGFMGTIPLIEAPYLKRLDLTLNRLYGSLPVLDSHPRLFHLLVSFNDLEGPLPDSLSKFALQFLELTNNTRIQGCFTSSALHPSSKYYTNAIVLSDTSISGILPYLGDYKALTNFQISGTQINLCAFDAHLESSIPICQARDLPYAPACHCASEYSMCSLGACSPESFSPLDGTPPYDMDLCNGVVPHIMVPTPTEGSCPLPQPSGGFTCLNGAWVASGSINVPSLTIPSGSTVLIGGNLTVGGSLVFSGFDSSIHVNGCIILGSDGKVIVTLTEEELKQLETEGGEVERILLQALNVGCSNSVDLSALVVTTQVPNKSCKKVKTSSSTQSNRETLALTFKLDSSKCQRWWIILVSVLGGVIVIVVAIVLLVTFHPGMRDKVRPFWRRG